MNKAKFSKSKAKKAVRVSSQIEWHSDNKKKFKTIVYIDGFNLFYGVLRWTPYKWLDLEKLFNKLLKNNDIIEIKYFTAIVKGSETNKSRKPNQINYINAIKNQTSCLRVIEGHFLDNVQKIGKDVDPPHVLRKIMTREEKWTDVNLAIHIVNDVHTRDFDCVCLVSNDSDLAEALKISQDNEKSVVLITPITYENLKKKGLSPQSI